MICYSALLALFILPDSFRQTTEHRKREKDRHIHHHLWTQNEATAGTGISRTRKDKRKKKKHKKQNTRAICRVCTGCVMRCRFHNAGTVFSPATTAAPHSTCVATIPALPSFSSSMRRHSYYSSSLSLCLSLSLSLSSPRDAQESAGARAASLSRQRWNLFLGFGVFWFLYVLFIIILGFN